MRVYFAAGLSACLLLQACSSRPREFTPTLTVPATSQSEFDAAYAECNQLLVEGKLDSAGRTASGAAGAAAGATTAAVGGAAATAVGGYAGLAAASATIILLPVAIIGGAWGMSRAKRAKKEAAIKTAMGGCLSERGYQVAGWSKALKEPVVVAERTAGN
jgi:hypothetical protein